MFSYRIIVWPKTLREFFIDDGRLRHVRVVPLGEKAAPDQRNLHGPKIIGARDTKVHLQFLARRRRVTFHVNLAPTHRSGQR
jgi:hypothetical protein